MPNSSGAPAYKIIDHTYDTVVVGAGGSGLRHFVMDIGAGYELKSNAVWSVFTPLAGVALTVLFWAAVLLK